MRKRNIFIGILALEILALPAAAHLHANMDKSDRVNVIAAEIKSPSGLKRFFVNSDGPFVVTARNLVGPNQVNVFEHGKIGEAVFGGNSQLPGTTGTCTNIKNQETHIIYRADKATIKNKGEAVSQAVLFSIVYNPDYTPEIEFLALAKGQRFEHASPCQT